MLRLTRLLIATAILAALTVGLRCDAAMSRYSVVLKANPQAIVADGRSETTITAEVTDSSGRNVPDGTVVDFTASLGIIQRTERTAAGVARVRLQSNTSIGTSVVSVVVVAGNAVATLRVDFLEPGTEMFDESFISVDSKKHLGFDVGSKIVDSAGGVTIYSRGMTIKAEEAQVDLNTNILRAKNGSEDITIVRGDKKVTASALYFDFNSMSGVIIAPASEGAKRLRFRGRDMHTEPDDDTSAKIAFDFKPISESTMFIKARSILIRPGEEVKFKRAGFYLDGDRVLSVPLHVEPLRGSQTSLNHMLTYGTDGLKVDIPFYYSLTPNGTGAVRLRHSQAGGWGYYSGNSGWQLDLEQDYNIGASTDGKFSMNKITSLNAWGARWNQRKEFNDNSTLYTYIDFPAHRDLYGNVDYSHPLGRNYTFSMNFRGDKVTDLDPRFSSRAYIQSRPKQILGDLASFTVTSRLSFDNYSSGNSRNLGGGLGLQLYGKPIQFGPNSSLNSSLSLSHDVGGFMGGTSVNANVGYSRALGRIGQLGLNYSYSSLSSDYAFSEQRISADLSLTPNDRWQAYFYGTFGVSDSSISAFGELSYTFLPTWRLHLLGNLQKFEGFQYVDAEVALAKAIGKQEIRIIWSQSLQRFRVEFSALSF